MVAHSHGPPPGRSPPLPPSASTCRQGPGLLSLHLRALCEARSLFDPPLSLGDAGPSHQGETTCLCTVKPATISKSTMLILAGN